jgi:hypothetical protein
MSPARRGRAARVRQRASCAWSKCEACIARALQLLPQYLTRERSALAAARRHAEAFLQVAETARAQLDRLAYLAVGDRLADAYVHGFLDPDQLQ